MQSFVLFWMVLIIITLDSCGQMSEPRVPPIVQPEQRHDHERINLSGNSIETRFLLPEGFERVALDANSFGSYLRRLPLKPHGTQVLYFDGRVKSNQDVYEAVVDLPIGKRDLHQCADAIMRLRATYLWEQERYSAIHFNFVSGFRADYSEWMQGNRIRMNGNRASWYKKTSPSNSADDLWAYLEMVFSYAGTASLCKELTPVAINNLEVGDVFIIGGSPGHAVIVLDMAEHRTTHERIFMLGQSYMPAQETQVLSNRNNLENSPWYAVKEIEGTLYTPEYTFSVTDLKRFQED